MNFKTQAHDLTLLKDAVLIKTGINHLNPGDCKLISQEIENTTGKLISETTLKRFFGFASRKFNFSRFTVNTLCEFVDVDCLESFSDASVQRPITIQHSLWAKYRKIARDISTETCNYIRRRSQIPFELTVSRNFATLDIEYFLRSKYAVTPLVAPSGMGKSILLTHLVKDFFLSESALFSKSICFFINCSSCSGLKDIENHFSKWLGGISRRDIQEDILNHFVDNPEEVSEKLVVILDGFDEYLYSQEQLRRLLNNIIDLLYQTDMADWFKVIISMRSTTWNNIACKNFEQIISDGYLYAGVYCKHTIANNIPALTDRELKEVLSNISQEPVQLINYNRKLSGLLRFPYFLERYYQQNEVKRLNVKSSFTAHELLEDFMRERIYRRGRSAEKVVLLHYIIELACKSNCPEKQIDKVQLLKTLDIYMEAYRDLIADDLIAEKKCEIDHVYHDIICFKNLEFYNYFLANYIIASSDEAVDLLLLKNQKGSEESKMDITCWLIFNYVKTRDQLNINRLLNFISSFPNNANVLNFTIEAIDKSWNNTEKKQWFTLLKRNYNPLYRKLFNLDYIIEDNCQSVLDLSDDVFKENNERVALKIMELFTFLVKLEKDKFLNGFEQLRKIDGACWQQQFPINPLTSLQFAARMLIGKNNCAAGRQSNANMISELKAGVLDDKSILAYKLYIIANNVAGNYNAVIKLINYLKKTYPKIKYDYSPGSFWIFLLIRLGMVYMEMGEEPTAFKIIGHLARYYNEKQNDNHFTSYTDLLFRVVIARMHLLKQEYEDCELVLEQVLKRSYSHNLRFFTLQALFLNIELYKKLENYTMADHYFERYLKLQKETGINNLSDFLLFSRSC